MPARIRYVQQGGVSTAFQVTGDGPVDLIVVPDFISHLDLQWSDPDWVRWVRTLGSFSRLILFDPSGTGLSDPITHIVSVEERSDELRAVLDAAGSDLAAVLAIGAGGPASLVFAATHPERVRSLILYGSFCEPPAPDARNLRAIEDAIEHWGEGRVLDTFAPSVAGDPVSRRFAGRLERGAASPAMVRTLLGTVYRANVSAVLPAIRVPTLVVHRTGDAHPVDQARAMARLIPGARLVEIPGEDHPPWLGSNSDRIVYEIEEFLTGTRRTEAVERVLRTVLFTDLVRSTERAIELGDHSWRALLERHDNRARQLVARHEGRVVRTMGDGLLATFDGPARAIRSALALSNAAEGLGLPMRAGIHTGECEIVGGEIGGIAVHIGARVAALAGAGEVLVSGTVRDLVVGANFAFAERGLHVLRGVPGEWALFAVTSP